MRHVNPLRSPLATVALALVLFTGPALAAGVSVDEASWADTNEATQQYKSGKRAYDKGDLEEALTSFRESYDTVASPNSHLMVARVLIDLKRIVAAYEELALVIEEAEAVKKNPEKYSKTADAARALRKELEGQLGFIQVSIPAQVTVAGREVPTAEWGAPIPLEAGTAAVDVVLADGTKRTEQVSIEAGKTAQVDLAPPAAKGPTPQPVQSESCPPEDRTTGNQGTLRQSTVGYAVGGLGAAGLVTFTIFGILDNQKFNDLESGCTNNVCPASLADDAEQGRTFQALANVGLGVGIVGLGTGAALLLTAPRHKREAATPGRPRLLVGPGLVAVKGKF